MYKIGIETAMKTDTEEGKVYWVVMNTVLNGLNINPYNIEEEIKMWAKGADYFPDLSWEEFLDVARKYEFWRHFEESLSP